MSHCSLHSEAHLHGQMPPLLPRDEQQLLKDRDVTKQPNALPHLSAPDGEGRVQTHHTWKQEPSPCSCSSWMTLMQHSTADFVCAIHELGEEQPGDQLFALLLFTLLKIWTVETHFL